MKKSIQRNDEYIPHPKILIKSMETAGFNKMQNYESIYIVYWFVFVSIIWL